MATLKKIKAYIKPMLAKTAKAPFSDPDWLFETKWDGCRAIAVCDGAHTLFYSRNGVSFATKYPAIFTELQKQQKYMILDGEVVAIGKDGKSDFQLLQDYAQHPGTVICFYVFDLLNYDHQDLTRHPLTERKAILKNAILKSDIIRYCDHISANGLDFFKSICLQGLEGMMAKRKNSRYSAGRRSSAWLKVKNLLSDEVVIIGYTAPKGARTGFGALLLARYLSGRLVYVGHTGTGFSTLTLTTLYQKMQPLIAPKPCLKLPEIITEQITWLKPELIAEVRFTEWTNAGLMRQPVFRGLREDKILADLKN